MEKFDKSKYDMEYRKLHKKRFGVDLNISEYEELDKLLKSNNLTKVEFVRLAIKLLNENKLKK